MSSCVFPGMCGEGQVSLRSMFAVDYSSYTKSPSLNYAFS
ncbi:hypothetical protein SLEP1_g21970 [Rubroshorea leprosula]|uniref:Uncharacterized protein n=1 Tax=Rubroshorea leprosula TaxID=152421 RepID=A0AAV5JJR6_9ROSI|nr:hypothetical protein SLEP1_g21970 [Rubroshorea leprosula]